MASPRNFRGHYLVGLDLAYWRVLAGVSVSDLAKRMRVLPKEVSQVERHPQRVLPRMVDRYVVALIKEARTPYLRRSGP